jgi:hypothetical protein
MGTCEGSRGPQLHETASAGRCFHMQIFISLDQMECMSHGISYFADIVMELFQRRKDDDHMLTELLPSLVVCSYHKRA